MRQLGTLLIFLGVLGLVAGVMGALAPTVILLNHDWSHATWQGMGPLLAGILLVLIGLLLRGADRPDLDL